MTWDLNCIDTVVNNVVKRYEHGLGQLPHRRERWLGVSSVVRGSSQETVARGIAPFGFGARVTSRLDTCRSLETERPRTAERNSRGGVRFTGVGWVTRIYALIKRCISASRRRECSEGGLLLPGLIRGPITAFLLPHVYAADIWCKKSDRLINWFNHCGCRCTLPKTRSPLRPRLFSERGVDTGRDECWKRYKWCMRGMMMMMREVRAICWRLLSHAHTFSLTAASN